MPREKSIEKYLRLKIEEKGGLCVKLSLYKGIPDRLILLPGATMAFAEVKTTGGVLSTAQKIFIKTLKNLGFRVFVPSSKEDVDALISQLSGEHD